MGFGSKRVTTYIRGRDKKTGEIKHVDEIDNMGSITGGYPTVHEYISKLDKKYPNLDWEYESWKD
jgi:hypothetical protein